MSVVVEYEPCLRRLFVTDGPQKRDPIPLVECVPRINEKEFPLLVFLVVLPRLSGDMNPSLYSRFQACVELFGPTRFIRLSPCNIQHAFGKKTPLYLPYSDWSYPWALI